MEPSGSVQSVTRALGLLSLLSQSETGAKLSGLARASSLPVSTTHRLLTTLEQSGFVHFDPLTADWHVGREAFAVGAAYIQRRSFIPPAMIFLRRLRNETRETVNLGVLEEGQIVTVAQVESREITRAISPPGGRVTATCSAMGKAILATFTDAQIHDFCRRNGFRSLTSRSHKSLQTLMADIEKIRDLGFAFDDEEHVTGLRCVAAAVRPAGHDAICAVSVSGLTNRMEPERIPVIAQKVIRSVEEFGRKF